MTLLLDTSVCIEWLRGSDPEVARAMTDAEPESVALCSVVKAELLFGARNSRRASHNLALLERFFAPLRSLPFDDSAADRYGALRAHLQLEGLAVGGNDMMIAATALAHDAVLVTRDDGALRRVPGLRVIRW